MPLSVKLELTFARRGDEEWKQTRRISTSERDVNFGSVGESGAVELASS